MKCYPKPIGCGEEVTYRIGGWDELTIKEFRISGLCDKCQDIVFAEPEEIEDPLED